MSAAVARQITATELYVERRLDAWGREFALDRTIEPNEITVLWLLVTYGGEIPRTEGGRKPDIVVDPEAWQVEQIVTDMRQHGRQVEAAVLRAYHGGRGRHKHERRECAELLAGCRITPARYFEAYARGVAWVSAALVA